MIAFFGNPSPLYASTRLRLLQPMENLRRLGFACSLVEPGCDVEAYRALVICKAHSPSALRLAQRARQSGVPIIFDLCDNLLASYHPLLERSRRSRLLALIAQADMVTVPTARMAEAIAQSAGVTPDRFAVAPDALEELADDGDVPWTAAVDRAARFLARQGGALKCVWFGNAVGKLSGYAALNRAAEELHRFSERHPVCLTILGSKRWRYWYHSRTWRVPSLFIPWELRTFPTLLRIHDVAVLPVNKNPFTVGKSLNRPATAIMAGLGVVADGLPSYQELSDHIFLDDWQGGLVHYAHLATRQDSRLEAARQLLRERYGPEANANSWAGVLSRLGVSP